MSVKAVQFIKVATSITLTWYGIAKVTKFVQDKKACLPICLIVLGKLILVAVQLAKPDSYIAVIIVVKVPPVAFTLVKASGTLMTVFSPPLL